MDGLTRHARPFADLGVRELHDILKLRVDVFVVEQACAYPEVDGRDVEPSTLHTWLADADGRIATYLRVLDDGPVQRIGRVVTATWARGRGLSGVLLAAVLEDRPREAVLDAQAHLVDLYARHGFVPDGEEFLDDGIPHVPMRRPAVRGR